MALTRTDTALLLEDQSTGTFYWVTLEDHGDDILVPDADETDPQADDGSDGYVPLVADDGQVYRWKLKSETADGAAFLDHDVTLSPNQSETTATNISIELAGTNYRISIGIEDDGEGNDVPILYVDEGGLLLLAISDSFSSSDSQTKAVTCLRLETFGISESVAKLASMRVADSFSMSDTISTLIVLVLAIADAFGITDAGRRDLQKNLIETITPQSIVAKLLSRSLTDNVTALDLAAKLVGKPLSESVEFDDEMTQQLLQIIAAIVRYPSRTKFTDSQTSTDFDI